MDNLSKDAMAAVQAGMTYGKWKVLHPHTKPIPTDVACSTKVRREQFEPCVVCGRIFEVGTHNQVTCSTECRVKHHRELNREYKRRKREQGG